MMEDKFLPVVDSGMSRWTHDLVQAQQSGSNFLMILPFDNGVKTEFCRGFGLAPERLPQSLLKSRLFLLGPHIDPRAFDRALVAMEKGAQVIFLEQLDLPTTQPPHVKPYIVYCDVWGILSQHNTRREARQSWSDCIHGVHGQRANPEPGIYKWEGQSWHSLEE